MNHHRDAVNKIMDQRCISRLDPGTSNVSFNDKIFWGPNNTKWDGRQARNFRSDTQASFFICINVMVLVSSTE